MRFVVATALTLLWASPALAQEQTTTTPAPPPATAPALPPPSDQPQSSAAPPATPPAPRPFAGSAIYNQNSMTTGTVFQGQTQYSNPTVESTLWLLPRYAINDAFQLRARAIISYEYTNSDSTAYRNEPVLSDTTLSLFYRKIPAVIGIKPALAFSVGLPTSKLSRARTLLFNPGVLLQLSRPIENALHGEGQVLVTVGYAHPVYRSANAEVAGERPPNSFSCFGGNNCQDLLSGTMNPSDTLSYSALVEWEWGKWSPALYYLGVSQWAYRPDAVRNPVDGTPVEASPGFEPTSVRQTHYVSTWLDYNFNTWFTGEIGFWNAVNAINGRGERANIFFDRNQDTRVYLGASIQLDNLVKVLQGAGEGEGGIVRAHNTKQPMWRF